MSTEIAIVRVFGVLYILVGLGMVLRADFYREAVKAIAEQAGLLFISGFFALLIGCGILALLQPPAGLVSWVAWIFGWLAAVEGGVYLLFPNVVKPIATFFTEKLNLRYVGVGATLLGVALVGITVEGMMVPV